MAKINTARRGFEDFDHLGATFVPWQDVRVVLIGPDQDANLAALRNRPAHTKQMHQFVEHRGCAGSGEDHRVLFGVAVAFLMDHGPGFCAQAGHPAAAKRCLGMAVGVASGGCRKPAS